MQEKEATGDAERAAAIAHMVSVLRDPKASDVRKDRMALALMQYGAAVGRKGKPPSKYTKGEERAERVKEIGQRFAVREAPKLVVSNA
jgi:hypothetical protein